MCLLLELVVKRVKMKQILLAVVLYGMSMLRWDHLTLWFLDFLGKDSIRFYQEVEVDRQVFKTYVFSKRNPSNLVMTCLIGLHLQLWNKHLQAYMKGLTAKVFRTYNASKTMQDQMDLDSQWGNSGRKVMKSMLLTGLSPSCVITSVQWQSASELGRKNPREDQGNGMAENPVEEDDFGTRFIAESENPKYFEELEDMTSEDS